MARESIFPPGTKEVALTEWGIGRSRVQIVPVARQTATRIVIRPHGKDRFFSAARGREYGYSLSYQAPRIAVVTDDLREAAKRCSLINELESHERKIEQLVRSQTVAHRTTADLEAIRDTLKAAVERLEVGNG